MKSQQTGTKHSVSSKTYDSAIKVGLRVGALAFISGFILCIIGLSGKVELIIEGGGFQGKLINASPGVVFAFLGLALMWKYKPKIKEEIVTRTTTEESHADKPAALAVTKTTKTSEYQSIKSSSAGHI